MPPNTKSNDQVYSYTNGSGKTVYSNSKEVKITVPNIQAPPFPTLPQQEKPTAQIIQPQIIAKPITKPKNGMAGLLSLMIVMAAIVMAFRLFLDNTEKKRREKLRALRPDIKKQEEPQKIVVNNFYYYNETGLPPQTRESTNIPSLTQLVAEKNKTQHAEQQIINAIFTEVIPPTTEQHTAYWTIEFIRSLEWREFEKLCAEILEEKGFQTKLGDFGLEGDGGKDIRIYRPQELEHPYALAQCKAQKSNIQVGEIRKLIGTMAIEKVSKGFFFTSSIFYKKAWEEGKGQGLELVDGSDLLTEIKNLPQKKQEAMIQKITNTDYMTPTCTVCGIKMNKRRSDKSDYKFWGCINYPRCQNKLKLRWTDK